MDERELREESEEEVGKEESGEVVRIVEVEVEVESACWGWESKEVKEVWKEERWAELWLMYWAQGAKGD